VRPLLQPLLGGQRHATLDQEHTAPVRQGALGHQHAGDAAAEHAEIRLTLG
jgi:hypothetical protein